MVTNDEVECSDDTISRQAAIATALEFFVEFLGGGFYENSQKELIARFQRLPSSQSCEYWDAESGYCALHRPSAQPERQINLDGTPIEILSALRSQFNCFDDREEKAYHALSVAIHALSAQERTSPCADCQEFDCYGCDEREN